MIHHIGANEIDHDFVRVFGRGELRKEICGGCKKQRSYEFIHFPAVTLDTDADPYMFGMLPGKHQLTSLQSEACLIHSITVAPGLLHGIHRFVRSLQQTLRILGIARIKGHTNTGGN